MVKDILILGKKMGEEKGTWGHEDGGKGQE